MPDATPLNLRKVKRLLGGLDASDRLTVSSGLIELAGEMEPGARLTIDATASATLGAPLVVLRLPAESGEPSLHEALTPREREVARLLAAGRRNREIAEALTISLSTVKDHVHHVLTKTGHSNRAALAASLAKG
jgi:DNA-binding NarL/FixJ family response regulator